jgi:hypothetical protein
MERLSGEELHRKFLEELPDVQKRLQEIMNNPRKRVGTRRRAARVERQVAEFLRRSAATVDSVDSST